TSAKKLKNQKEIEVPENCNIQYAIIDFCLVFSTLANFVKCSNVVNEDGNEILCNGKVEFQQCSKLGLGFKIMVKCEKCNPKYISSSDKIGQAYTINRRFIFVMRVLGLGLAGCNKFCGLMDICSSFLNQSSYDFYITKIHECISTVGEKLLSLAAEEEKNISCAENNIENTTNATVSGDGTWKRRGFASLYGVATLIGYYSGKVLDLFVKSSYCKSCETWKRKLNTAEYEDWYNDHIENDECMANHQGAAGNMEVTSIVEMFKRSFEKHGLRYSNYIGDGDSKTYSVVLNAKPYGENFEINKKECVGHVQKRMGKNLRELVNKTVEEKVVKGKTIRRKILSGEGKLSGPVIDKLTVYYGLAIRRHSNSIQDMKNAIWATYYHYSSTDEHPQHDKCPSGIDSWCVWQSASAADTLSSFKHDKLLLSKDILAAIKPIYENLSEDVLLERCLGGFTQNNNESLNQLIWKISPKVLPAGSKIAEIAAYIAACIFNEGTSLHQLF
ncbi:hypothetical protein ALC62_11778, partial [Cyphomyrmex costatus]